MQHLAKLFEGIICNKNKDLTPKNRTHQFAGSKEKKIGKKGIELTFRASETRVFPNLIFAKLLKFMKILKTHFCLKFTILQLFLKFHYNLSHRSNKGMQNTAYRLPILVMRISRKRSHWV